MKKTDLKNQIVTGILLLSLITLFSCKSKSLYHSVSTAPVAHVTQLPTFTPDEGTYDPGSLNITISTEVGATIKYTTDGSDPKTSGTVITASSPTNEVSLTINQHTIIKAYSFMPEHFDSDLISGVIVKEYVMSRAANPVIAPGTMPGPHTDYSSINVSITSATTGATIRYTTDGSTPTKSSSLYTGAFNITTNTTIKAFAYSDGTPVYDSSDIVTMQYNVKVASTTANVASGTYNNDFNVSLSNATSGATIYYTLDGSEPTTGSTPYSGAIAINGTVTTGGIATLKARAFKADCVSSDIITFTYTLKVANPVFTHPTGGPFGEGITTESLTCSTIGATIAYDFNSSPQVGPEDSGASPLSVNEIDETLTTYAYAYKAGYQDSNDVSRNYTENSDNMYIP